MRTVLIADRSLTIRRVVEHALGGRAARVCGAADADELFRLARVESPDIVVCDAALPGVSLQDLREALAALPKLADAPLVLLTSALDPLDAEEAEKLGASALLVKPFEIASLVETLERALERGVVAAPRPRYPADEDLRPETDESRAEDSGSIPEPPSFESVWEEGDVGAGPDGADAMETPHRDAGSDADDDPLALAGASPISSGEDEEPLGPLSLSGADLAVGAGRVPLPGDEDFRLGVSALPEHDDPALASDGSVDERSRDRLTDLEPELRVLVERIVREVAWDVVPDIIERIIRERASGVVPDSSSGDRKP